MVVAARRASRAGAVSYTHLDVYKRQVLGCASGNEVLGPFHVAVLGLHPFVAGEVPCGPGLAAFGLAADPVAHDEALVGVTLALDALIVVELALKAAQCGGVRADGFDAEVELGEMRKDVYKRQPSLPVGAAPTRNSFEEPLLISMVPLD